MGEVDDDFAAKVVDLVRRTRDHPEIRVGSSVRGAVDLVLVAASLASLRGRSVQADDVSMDATLAALSGRIRLHEGATRTPEEILRELWREVFGSLRSGESDDEGGGGGKATTPSGSAPRGA